MAELSDREHLEKLAREKREAKQAEAARQQQQEVDEARRQAEERASDEQKTEEIFDYCTKTFVGHRFEETNHELRVKKDAVALNLGIKDEDGVKYVMVCTDHVGHDLATQIPLLAARFRFGQYELRDKDRPYKLTTFEELRVKLLDLISGMDRDYMRAVLDKVRGLRRR